jgi:hypothetical protein
MTLPYGNEPGSSHAHSAQLKLCKMCTAEAHNGHHFPFGSDTRCYWLCTNCEGRLFPTGDPGLT